MAPLDFGPSRRHGARIASAGGAVAVQRIEPRAQIRIVAAGAALADDCGDLGGALRLALRGRIHHHARKPGRQRQLAQMPAFLGDAAVRIDGAKLGEQRPCRGKRRARRRIEERKPLRSAAPCREVERERRQIGGEDFRPGIGFERRGLRLVPQPVAKTRLDASGTAAALIGRSARHPHGLKPRQFDGGP